MAFTDIASPAAGTSCTTCSSESDGIFTAQYSYAFQTLLGDDIAGEHLMIFVDDATQVGDKLFHSFLEVGMQIGLHTTDSVVVHNKASAASFLEDVEYLLAVAETIEERGQSTKVHCETRVEQQVRVYALQFVHDGTDILHTVAYFNAHSLLDACTKGVAVLMCAQIIQTVSQCQCLRVGETFAHLLDAPVDVAAVGIYLLDGFTFQ